MPRVDRAQPTQTKTKRNIARHSAETARQNLRLMGSNQALAIAALRSPKQMTAPSLGQ